MSRVVFFVVLLGSTLGHMLTVSGNPIDGTTTTLAYDNTATTDSMLKKLSTNRHSEETTTLPIVTTSSDGACNSTFNCSSDHVEGTSLTNGAPIQPLLSRKVLFTFKRYMDPIHVFLYVLAFVLNGFNISVFMSQARSSTNLYLTTISAMDILFSICGFIQSIYSMLSDDFSTLFYSNYVIYFELYFKPVSQRIIFFLVFMVSIDRLLVVAYPLKAKGFVFMRHPKFIIMIAVLVPGVYYIFSPFRFKIGTTKDPITNATKYPLIATHHDQTFLRVMSTTGNFLFVYVLLIGGLVLNLLVVFSLKRHSKKRQQMKTTTDTDKAARRERQTTITIITSSLVFLLLSLPHATNAMAFALLPGIYGPYTPYHNISAAVELITKTLSCLSLSTDFVAYFSLSTSFKTTFFRILHIKQTRSESRYTDQKGDQTTDQETENSQAS